MRKILLTLFLVLGLTTLGLAATNSLSQFDEQNLSVLNDDLSSISLGIQQISNALTAIPTFPLSVTNGGTGSSAAANSANGVVINDSSGYLVGDGRNLTNLPGQIPTGMQAFTSSGTQTWTKPAGVTKVWVKVWGAGGGGGGTSINTTGGTGGTSSFAGYSVTLTSTGGSGGVGGDDGATGGAAGTGSNGSINLTGVAGSGSHSSGPGNPGGSAWFAPLTSLTYENIHTGTPYYTAVRIHSAGKGGDGLYKTTNYQGGGGGGGGYSEGIVAVSGNCTVNVGAGGSIGDTGAGLGDDGLVLVYW